LRESERASEWDFKDLRQGKQAGRRGLQTQKGRRTEQKEEKNRRLCYYHRFFAS
jgi:hypothetical protein